MTDTTNLNITLLETAQAQKEVTMNEALARLDAVLNRGAIDRDLATPPGSPAAGDLYIVAASATDDWAGHDGEIAYFDQIWRFVAPNEGMVLWVADEDALYSWDGSSWALAGLARKQSLWLPPQLWRPQLTNGSGGATNTSSGGDVDLIRFSFGAGSATYSQYMWKPPAEWDLGTLSFRALCSFNANDKATVWGLQAVALSHDDDPSAASYGTAQEVTVSGGSAANDVLISAESAALTVGGSPASGDLISLRVYRDPGHASDDFGGTALCLGVEVYYGVK